MFKKILLAAAVLVSAASAIEFGPRVGGNMTTMWGDDAEKVTTGFGFNAGIAAKLAFKDSPISIAPEVVIDMRNTNKEDFLTFKDRSMTEWSLDIPVMIRCELLGLIYIEAGPSFNFNLSTSEEWTEGITKKSGSHDYDGDELSSFEFGLSFGVGTNIISSVDIDFRVNMGLTDIFTDKASIAGYTFSKGEAPAMKNLQFALGASIWLF